jgi:hypothetical protein
MLPLPLPLQPPLPPCTPVAACELGDEDQDDALFLNVKSKYE